MLLGLARLLPSTVLALARSDTRAAALSGRDFRCPGTGRGLILERFQGHRMIVIEKFPTKEKQFLGTVGALNAAQEVRTYSGCNKVQVLLDSLNS